MNKNSMIKCTVTCYAVIWQW